MLLVGGESENVPLYYHMYDNFQIQFEREEFHGKHITGKDVEDLIESKSFKKLDDDDVISLCCIGILQLVLLGLEDRRAVPSWILRLANDIDGWDDYPWGSYVWPALYYQLRDANVKHWLPLYASEPTNEDDKKSYSICEFTWAFKGRVPAERLIPDEVEVGSGWWLSSRAYFDGCVTERERRPRHIQFGREEFCLVTGLMFGVEYSDDYDDNDKPIPFRRRVFPSCLDGILQLVLLGLEDRRAVPSWILRLENDRDGWDDYPWGSYVWPALYYQLRDANVKRWLPLYATEPTNEDDKKSYSICEFTWAFKTWILEVFRLGENEYYTRHRRYPRIGREPAERLISDEVEVGLGWWLSSRAYFDGCVTERERRPGHVNCQNHYEGGSSPFQTPTNNSIFNMGTSTNWKTSMPLQPDSSNWQSQMPGYTPTLNWQPPISSHPGDAGLCDPNILKRPRRVQRSSVYIHSPYTSLPATTKLPKKWVGRPKKNSKNDNLSPLNPGNAFAHDNVGGGDVLITGIHDIGIYFTYENVDPNKVYMPMNVGGNHRVTGAVNLTHSIFYVFDSMESQCTRLLLEAQIKSWAPVINGILQIRVVPRESDSYWENIRYEMGKLFYKCRCENTRYCGYD
nr:phospholipase-like protein [Tanacetum cinerariifolium]